MPRSAAPTSTSATNCSDGTWQFDTIASGTFGSTLTLTTGTPNRTAGAIPAGGVMFYFGAISGSLLDPATGLAAWKFGTLVSTLNTYTDALTGEYPAVHQGDPLLIYDANATAADSVTVTGYWGAR